MCKNKLVLGVRDDISTFMKKNLYWKISRMKEMDNDLIKINRSKF